MRAIRASEIGTYLYCERAWGYVINGYESQNKADMAAGTQVHEQHGKAVVLVRVLRVLATILLLVALVLVVMYLTGKVIS